MARISRAALLSPEEVLERFHGGPMSGLFTDGSCEGNPGPGGWGVVWVENNRIRAQKSGVEAKTTNNRMELTALIEAFSMLPPDADVTVHSDSELCVKTINEWAAGWEARGWRRKIAAQLPVDGSEYPWRTVARAAEHYSVCAGEIKNLELVKRLYALARAHPKARLCWIRAHDGSRWNEYVDALASAYMR
jgi:ribonuclease HI